jgi:hypothetical protein
LMIAIRAVHWGAASLVPPNWDQGLEEELAHGLKTVLALS